MEPWLEHQTDVAEGLLASIMEQHENFSSYAVCLAIFLAMACNQWGQAVDDQTRSVDFLEDITAQARELLEKSA